MKHAREMWEAMERYHQLCYVAPEVRVAGDDAGLKGFWMNYFATRAAPMGTVTAEVVQSVFFYYSPTRIRRAIPDAWHFSDPERILAARYRAMDQALRRELGGLAQAPELTEAITLVARGLEDADVVGKPLFAGWRGIEQPTEPHLALWHLATLSREYRSGCHLIALAASGLDGCESVVSQVAVDQAPLAWITDEAGWTEEDAAAATARLVARGWLHPDGTATAAGYAGRQAIEETTDALDGERWTRLAKSDRRRLLQLMASLTAAFPPDDQLDWQEIYGRNAWGKAALEQ